jgi:HAD superfamily hydrolase (TIGR01509 family)
MALRALLFDLDGTLADTEAHGHRPSYNRAFRKLGLGFRWGPKLYRRLLKQPSGRERLLHYLRRYQPELGEHAEAVSESEDAWVEHVHRLKSRYFRRYLRQGKVPLRPGVARLLREASEAGLRLAVVTNASRSSVKPFLKYGLGQELAQRISLVVGGDQIAARKPAPDLYRYALSKLKLAPYECIAIEDSAMGLKAARAAGVPTVITVNSDTLEQDFSAASLVLDALGEPEQPSRVLAGRMDEAHLGLKTLRRIARSAAPRL